MRKYLVDYVRLIDEDIKDPDKFSLYADTAVKASKFMDRAIKMASSYIYTNETKGF